MGYQIAVASSDGKFVNQHFGRATQFLIFKVDSGQYAFSELRKNQSACGYGEHNEIDLQASINLIADCKVVLVSQIGPGAQQALSDRGIRSFNVVGFIDEILQKILETKVSLS